MAEVLDWSDPSKLMSRDGGDVLSCGRNEGLSGSKAIWVVIRLAWDDMPIMYSCHENGAYLAYSTEGHPCDIIPRPREPKTIDAWVDPETLNESRPSARSLYTYPEYGCVKVKITEVLGYE